MSCVLKEYRCHGCQKLLFKGVIVDSVIEIKCKTCHVLNAIEERSANEYLCGIVPCPHRVPVGKI
jgi:phage FluMu protein Com